jgi:hypothetical protein
MTKYQTDLLEYLKDYTEFFVETLLARQTDKIVVIDDVFPHIIDFLKTTLKRDMTLYEHLSPGYSRHLDMLIEAMNTQQNSPFGVALVNAINGIYRN